MISLILQYKWQQTLNSADPDLKEQSDQGLHYLPFFQHLLDASVTAVILGVVSYSGIFLPLYIWVPWKGPIPNAKKPYTIMYLFPIWWKNSQIWERNFPGYILMTIDFYKFILLNTCVSWSLPALKLISKNDKQVDSFFYHFHLWVQVNYEVKKKKKKKRKKSNTPKGDN